MKNSKQSDMLDKIDNVFGPGDEFLILMGDGFIGGTEGVRGLRLVGNCLFQNFDEGAELREPRPSAPPPKGTRAAKVRKALRRLARVEDAWVVCYLLDGTDEWAMAWSESLEPGEAYLEVVRYVRCGIELWD